MIENLNYIALIGFVGQGLFFSRFFIQLVLSEKNKKIITPSIFWKLSLLASILFFIYGYLREDFSIMLGQVLTYFIYIRNLQLQGEWNKLSRLLKICIYIFPLTITVYAFNNNVMDYNLLFKNEDISTSLLLLGVVAQVIFVFRFVYQWIASEKKQLSHLPLGFWVISLIGSSLILTYAILRDDVVLFIAHIVGIIVYLRNIAIWRKQVK